MDRPAFDVVAAAVADHGPITFAEYMDLALYGPTGYFRNPPVGPRGDFVTSPHVHPVFGSFVADAVRTIWDTMDRPEPFHLIEAGAGDGTMLRQMLDALVDLPVLPVATERSSGARRSLASIDGVTVLDHLPPSGSGVVVAHELLDNLVFRRVRGTDAGPREVRITAVDGELHEVLTPLDDLAAPHPLAPGEESIVPVGAVAFALEALRVPEPRALLAIDYGSEHAGGEVHGYRDHRVVEDVLRNPGATDITAGVDFGALRNSLEADGLQVFDPLTQRQALTALGFEPWFLTQLERQRDLLNTGRGTEAVRTWGDRSRSTLLVDPGGLGRFRWFLASNVPMPEPAWMTEARTTPD